MQYAIAETDNGPRLVDSQGKIIQKSDVDRRVLHVLPKLYVDDPVLLRSLRPEHVRLSVIADQADLKHLQPSGDIQVTQCVPNKGYFIGGCQDTRYGWFVPLPDDIAVVDLVFHWEIESGHFCQRIEHEIQLNLLPGAYHTWSMDVSAWHRVHRFEPGKPPLVYQPTTPLWGVGFAAGRNVEVIDLSDDWDAFVYIESLDVPAIPFSDMAYVEGFQEKQLHEIHRQTVFTKNNEAHRENAVIEMPREIFVAAVRAAMDVPFGKDTEYPNGRCTEHPAMKILSDWWNARAPEHRCASFAMPWVRVEEDAEEYWCGYYETPNEPFAYFAQYKSANARVGDAILIEFMRQVTEADVRPHGHGLDVFLVNGTVAQTVGVTLEDIRSGACDEAWLSLEALRRFPGRFPEVWQALVEGVA
ncbi:hypothetical protein B1757_02705 [Acidithiobacillus marinus]|uniref:Uncharacterized protein n=1 Tax=Acidithiobacillus marinus TaxID=187490 RepID=A0A2I1DPC0_9PROT|nr:hypothetical protein [Acidithiobacillus marinus]PKY11717.1 hypothetical protein B1757_02705 [Acidithiobacillus marinus]